MARVDYISEISNYKMDWNFKVRVVHIWHATPRDKPNFLLSIELVLQDEKGEKIHATISRSVVHRFRGEKNAIKEMELRKTITVTFWGKFVDKIMSHLHNLIDEPVIVVIQLIRAHKFQELAAGTVQLKNVKELLDSVQVGHLWILTKIVNLKLKNNCSYLDCIKCHKSVEEVAKNTFYCKKCGRDYQTATHRYRVHIKVMDDTGIVSLLLWDNKAITFIEKSASELKDCSLEIFDSPYECSYPIELDVLLNRIIMFRVNVKEENIESRDRVYGVMKINDNEELINQYKKSLKKDVFTELHFNVEEGSNAKKDFVYDNEKISPKKI
ncbi:uncharacterized protein LOC124898780 [Capsicum annuum]|uniref:uncharacterized protein LOC124898780 n=1 Tax=Capsicum annuum TaxID=4072 RepID=UPI001FB06422|nr:uncharacterized protein LOC124898780 [Capsicum annuum]